MTRYQEVTLTVSCARCGRADSVTGWCKEAALNSLWRWRWRRVWQDGAWRYFCAACAAAQEGTGETTEGGAPHV
jgi:hypothetical protein